MINKLFKKWLKTINLQQAKSLIELREMLRAAYTAGYRAKEAESFEGKLMSSIWNLSK